MWVKAFQAAVAEPPLGDRSASSKRSTHSRECRMCSAEGLGCGRRSGPGHAIRPTGLTDAGSKGRVPASALAHGLAVARLYRPTAAPHAPVVRIAARRGVAEFPALCRRRGAHRRRRSMIRTEPRPPLHHGSRIGVVTHRAGALADGPASAWRQANDRLSKLVDRELQAGVDQSVRQKVPGRGVARPPARPAGSPSWTRRMA
jgi:hypothetical protein